MKHLLTSGFLATSILLGVFANAQDAKVKVKEDKAKMKATEASKKTSANMEQDMSSPYTAQYSSKFEIGDQKLATMVLNLYKSWENNALEKSTAMVTDDITFAYSDGRVIKGKDNVLAAPNQERASLSSSQLKVHAFVSLHSIDRNENAVLVNGTREDVSKDGSKRVFDFITVFGINQQGKVGFIRPYTSKSMMQQ